MQIQDDNSPIDCSRLHDYLDGNMSSAEDRAFGSHASECDHCLIEIELDSDIRSIPDEIVLPKDFSKVVAANAESQVSGLRKRNERKVTFGIIIVLAVLVFVVLGANLPAAAGLVVFVFDQLGALLLVVGSFVFNLLFGIVVIAKVALAQVDLSFATVVGFFGIGLGSLLAYLLFTGRLISLGMAKR